MTDDRTAAQLQDELAKLRQRVGELETEKAKRNQAEAIVLRLNRTYATLSKVNEAIVRVRDRQQLLEEICTIAIEEGRFLMAWFGIVEEDADTVTPVASCGETADSYLNGIQISIKDVSAGRGPTGTAVRERRPVICNDIEHEAAMLPWREKALKMGYRSSAALPIIVGSRLIAVLSLYAPEVGFFDADELILLQELASNVAYAAESSEQEERRRQAEEALRHERDVTLRVAETSPVGIVVADPRGQITFANNRAKEVLGLSKDDVTRRAYNAPAWRITDYDGGPFPDEALPFSRVLATGQPVWDVRHAIESPDGRRLLLSINAAPLIGKSGQVEGMVATVEDVTRREQNEEALRESEERFRLSFEEGPIGMIMAGLDYKFIRVNSAMSAMLGYAEQELTGRTFVDITYPEDSQSSVDLTQRLFKGEIPSFTLEKRYIKKDGDFVWARVTATVIRDRSGQSLYSLAMIEDIDKRRQAEETLKALEEKYRAIVETANEGIALMSADDRVSFVNPKMAEMLGYAPEEIVGKPTATFLSEERKRLYLEYLKERRKGSRGRHETRLLRKDGATVDTIVSVSPFLDEKGRYLGLVSIFTDVGDLKRAEEALERSLEKLAKILRQTIDALASTIERRDAYTSGHQRRVAELASTMAREMGLAAERITGIEMAAIIHDIGKIAIPSEILARPRQLRQIEMSFIRTHPQVGYEILKAVEFTGPVAAIILQHHERMDGSGYPLGLSGEDILLEARIIGVADVVEAMMSHRPYRPALGIDQALAEIAQQSGVLYDPRVVDTCLRLFNDKGFQFDEESGTCRVAQNGR